VNHPVRLPPAAHEPADIAKALLAMVASGGADPRRLAREAGLPTWAIAHGQALVPAQPVLRLWELAEHALGPQVGLAVMRAQRPGGLRLSDYLLSTAATFREGMRTSVEFGHLVTTNRQVQLVADTGSIVTYSVRNLTGDGRGQELAVQFSLACMCARVRAETGRQAVPVHIAFAQPAPRSLRSFAEAFGTRNIDFGAPVTAVTLRTADVDAPLLGADPALAAILRSYAGTLPPPASASWQAHFQELLDDAITNGNPSLDAMARRLGISVRTLQRELTKLGTTWRAELDLARKRRADRARDARKPSMGELASRLAYADARSVRRAMHRWDGRAGDGTRHGA
jgi:AraC-like DNA-binding protein